MDIASLFILFGIVQAGFFGMLLLTFNRGNRKANRIMGVLMFLFGLSILHTVLFRLNLYIQFPHSMMIVHPIVFLFGPFLLWYSTLSAQPDFKLKPVYFIHLLPFVMHILYLLPTVFLKTGAYKLELLQQWNKEGNPASMIVSGLQVLQIFAYLFCIEKKLRNRERRLKNNYSALKNLNLQWIRTITYLLAGVFFIITLLLAAAFIFPIADMQQIASIIIGVSVSGCIFVIGFFAMRQPEIFTQEAEKQSAKYRSSPLTNDRSEKWVAKLEQLMHDKKPYLDNELTLAKLASLLGIPAYQLSQIINEKQHMSFFDYINMFRVNQAKQLLSNPQQAQFSILSIGFDSGFNSKSSFNAAFKKHAHITPSEYRRAHLACTN